MRRPTADQRADPGAVRPHRPDTEDRRPRRRRRRLRHQAVLKPFDIEELFARMRAVARRATAEGERPTARIGAWTVDLATHRVRPASGEGGDQRLTPTEWRILEVLVRHPGRLVTQRQLLEQVWGPSYITESGYLRLYMAQLRRKLEPEPARPRYLLTEPGMGYRYNPPHDVA